MQPSKLHRTGFGSLATIAMYITNYFDSYLITVHDDVIKWKPFPRYWPFVRGIHRSLVNSPRKGQWRRALLFSLICPWINSWVNNREAGDLRRHRTHYDVIVMANYSANLKNLTEKSSSYGERPDYGLSTCWIIFISDLCHCSKAAKYENDIQ